MYLPTYTSIWKIERRLYKLYDWVLPMPISITQTAVFGSTLALWAWLLQAFGVPAQANTGWLFLLPPGFAAWASGRPLIEEKRPHELVTSQVRYVLEPRQLHRLTERRESEHVRFFGNVWTPRSR
ncbi:MAG: TcpE family conjugal transfer membrane protein [Egibacteraceae bacterium]